MTNGLFKNEEFNIQYIVFPLSIIITNTYKHHQNLIKNFMGLHLDRFSPIILTSDHDDTDSSSSAQLNGASDLLTRGIQHTHAANKGQVSLRREM